MRCPLCNFPDSRVLDSRPAEEGTIIRRRRECVGCSRRFTTYERVEELPLIVTKKNGRRELFDRSKVLRGLMKACDKRSMSMLDLEQMTDEVERELRNKMLPEIAAEEIGQKVMEKLRDVDEIAYVRFASVYRRFTDVNSFVEEIEALPKKSAEKPEALE